MHQILNFGLKRYVVLFILMLTLCLPDLEVLSFMFLPLKLISDTKCSEVPSKSTSPSRAHWSGQMADGSPRAKRSPSPTQPKVKP
jgi:hypothetical protein